MCQKPVLVTQHRDKNLDGSYTHRVCVKKTAADDDDDKDEGDNDDASDISPAAKALLRKARLEVDALSTALELATQAASRDERAAKASREAVVHWKRQSEQEAKHALEMKAAAVAARADAAEKLRSREQLEASSRRNAKRAEENAKRAEELEAAARQAKKEAGQASAARQQAEADATRERNSRQHITEECDWFRDAHETMQARAEEAELRLGELCANGAREAASCAGNPSRQEMGR